MTEQQCPENVGSVKSQAEPNGVVLVFGELTGGSTRQPYRSPGVPEVGEKLELADAGGGLEELWIVVNRQWMADPDSGELTVRVELGRIPHGYGRGEA